MLQFTSTKNLKNAFNIEKNVVFDDFIEKYGPTLQKAACEIANFTYDNDLIVLLGQSPVYLKPFLEHYGRNVVSIAYSGKAFSDEYSQPTNAQISGYYKYLQTINSLIAQIDGNGRIVVIDFVISGHGIEGFSDLMHRLFKEKRPRIDLIQLTHSLLTPLPGMKQVYMDRIG